MQQNAEPTWPRSAGGDPLAANVIYILGTAIQSFPKNIYNREAFKIKKSWLFFIFYFFLLLVLDHNRGILGKIVLPLEKCKTLKNLQNFG